MISAAFTTICWIGTFLFAFFCIGDAIALIGWSLSWWDKPELNTFFLVMALLTAGLNTLVAKIDELSIWINKVNHAVSNR